MPDFNALLDKDPTQFERPPLPPEGDYLLLIKSKTFGQSAKKKTPFVEFAYAVVAPMPTIPMEALEGIDMTRVKLRDEFYITEDAMYRLREFFELVGVVMPSTRESIDACVGQQVIGTVAHSQGGADNSRTFANIRGYLKPEA
jgi:hypothetical protein